MANILKPRRTGTAALVPTTTHLADGELGINYTDKKIYQRVGSTIHYVANKGLTSVNVGFTNGPVTAFGSGTGDSFTTDLSWPTAPNAGLYLTNGAYVGDSPHFKAVDASEVANLGIFQAGIQGLEITTVTASTTITVGPGVAYVESAARMVTFAGGTITGSGGTNTMNHVYLTNTGTIEKSTTAPTTAYYGTARSKTGDTSRRYLGSVYSISAISGYRSQRMMPSGNDCVVHFPYNAGVDGVLVNAGTATTPTDLSCATYAPAGPTTSVRVRLYNPGAAGLARLYSYNTANFVIHTNAGPIQGYMCDIWTDTTPKIQYDVTSTSQGTVHISGYTYQR